MSGPRVLCLGEMLFDCLADQSGRDLPDVESWTPYPGGAPANVACALTKLGTSAGFIGCLGQDDAGDQLVQILAAAQVDISGLQRHPQAPTRQVYVTRTLAGDRCFAGFGDHDTHVFADTQLQADQLPESLFAAADFLVLGTLNLAYPHAAAAVHRALQLAHQHHLQILIDVNWRPVFWDDPDQARQTILQVLPEANYVKLAQEEATWLWGTTDVQAIHQQLAHSQAILLTAGEQGCHYCWQDMVGYQRSFTMDVVDTTGAGDAFVAGFIHQLHQHGPLEPGDGLTAQKIIAYASAVGALTTTQAGAIAAQPTALQVTEFLAAIALNT